MTEAKYTPGPWIFVETHGERESDGWPYVNREIRTEWVHPQLKGQMPVVGVCQNVESSALWVSPADARLIAAAPELLEALISLVAEHDSGQGVSFSGIGHARDAITKATGEGK